MRKQTCLIVALLTLLGGCAINPVTGIRELSLVPESQEISIGDNQYGPSRQMQGGDYQLDPALTAYVNEVGQRLAGVSDRQLPYEFVVLNNSTPNAWTLPGGKIAVNRGLLVELNNEAELAAVLSHEIVHAAARHGAKNMERGLLLQGAVMAAGMAVQGKDYGSYVVGGAQVAAGLLHSKYSRDAEREADFYGMQYMARAGYEPRAAITLQETFVKLSEANSHNWLQGLFASHPPSQERVEHNRNTASELPRGLLAQATYQERIARLKKSARAYEAYEQGQNAFNNGKIKKAESLAKKAIELEPADGHILALLGDIQATEGNYPRALDYYNQALASDDGYFYYYLQRGLTRIKAGDLPAAHNDLDTSIKLLPTAIAYNALGNIESVRGNRRQAKQYFQAAAGSPSEPGRQALQSLIKLDLPDNPGNYIKTRASLDSKGYIIVEITNTAPLPVRHVRLIITYPDKQGLQAQAVSQVQQVIAANTTLRAKTDIGPVRTPVASGDIKTSIVSAALTE